MISVEDAFAQIVDGVDPLSTEKVAVANAHLRVLATPLNARRSQPAAPLSAMDGYAVRSADLSEDTVTLTQVFEMAAGTPAVSKLEKGGTCCRIFTGAIVPEGADQVVPQEQTSRDGMTIHIRADAQPGRNIRPAETDFRARQPVLDAGTVLTAKSIVERGAAT